MRQHELNVTQQRWRTLREEAGPLGVITLAMAGRHGISGRSLRWRAAKEQWTRLQPGVWLLPGYQLTHWRRCYAAQCRTGPRVVIAARSAAVLHGLRREPPGRVEMIVGRERSAPSLAGVRARQTRTLLRREVAQDQHGLWLTVPARTVGDAARVLARSALLYVAIRGVQQRLCTHEELRAVRARMWPAAGSAALGWVLTEMQGLDSGFEWTVRQGLRAAALPEPHPEPYELTCPDGRDIHLDVAWPSWRVGVEAMGLSAHGMATQRVDQVRHNQATAGEWTILYVGWERWRLDRAKVLDEVRTVLRSRGANV